MTLQSFNIYDMIFGIVSIILLVALLAFLSYLSYLTRKEALKQEKHQLTTLYEINENIKLLYNCLFPYEEESKKNYEEKLKLCDGGESKK